MRIKWELPTEQARLVLELIEDALEFTEDELIDYARQEGEEADLEKFRTEQALLSEASVDLRAILGRN